MNNSIDKALGVVESLPLKIPTQEIVNKVPDELAALFVVQGEHTLMK